jgi:hypothetical protein
VSVARRELLTREVCSRIAERVAAGVPPDVACRAERIAPSRVEREAAVGNADATWLLDEIDAAVARVQAEMVEKLVSMCRAGHSAALQFYLQCMLPDHFTPRTKLEARVEARALVSPTVSDAELARAVLDGSAPPLLVEAPVGDEGDHAVDD